jgi:hypothetical protein
MRSAGTITGIMAKRSFWNPTPLKLIIAVVLGAGGYFLASNAHFDAFPCQKANYNYDKEGYDAPQSEICSLLQIKRSGEEGADRAKLTGGGYAVMVLLFGVAPLLVGFALGHALQRKQA